MPTIITARWQLSPATTRICGLEANIQALSRATTHAQKTSPPANLGAASVAAWLVLATHGDSAAPSTPRYGALPTAAAVGPRLVVPATPAHSRQIDHRAGCWSREQRFWTWLRAREFIQTTWRARISLDTPMRRRGGDSQKHCRDKIRKCRRRDGPGNSDALRGLEGW